MMNNLNYCCACNFGTSRAKTAGNEINCNFTIWRCLNYRIIDSTRYYRISDTLDELSRTIQYWSPVYMVHWYIMMVYLYRSFSKRIKYGSVKAFCVDPIFKSHGSLSNLFTPISNRNERNESE